MDIVEKGRAKELFPIELDHPGESLVDKSDKLLLNDTEPVVGAFNNIFYIFSVSMAACSGRLSARCCERGINALGRLIRRAFMNLESK